MNRRIYRIIPFVVLALILGLSQTFEQTQAQETCDVQISAITSNVQQTCTNIGRDRVCYGNIEIDAVPRSPGDENFRFEFPGDEADVTNIQSLYLSSYSENEDVWGIAQMRLLADLTGVPQDITILLFGDVEVEPAIDARPAVDVQVTNDYNVNIRSLPTVNALVIQTAAAGETLTAIGRLENNNWVRVRESEQNRVGWVSAEVLELTQPDDLEMLQVDSADVPYFGPMHALYYQSGDGDQRCGNVVTDGMLIQTPEGLARITMLINEVSIDLIDGGSGATAFVEANPENGMDLSMINGSADVTVGDTTVAVNTGQQVTVPLDENLSPTGALGSPTDVDVDQMQNVVLLPVAEESVAPLEVVPSDTDTGTSNNPPGDDNSNAAGNGTGNSTGNANGNGTGNSTGNANGNANGNASGNGSGNANGDATGNGNGNANGNSNGNANGNANGNSNGNANGNANGNSNGNANGNANGNSNGNANGNANGNSNGNANGNANGNSNGNGNGNANGNSNGNGNG